MQQFSPISSIEDKPQKAVVVILAAGESRRFDGIKQLAMLDKNRLMLGQTLDALKQMQNMIVQQCKTDDALPVNLAHIALVLGGHHQQIMSNPLLMSSFQQVEVIHNHQWQQGLSSSIHSAVHFAQNQQADALMLVLADQVALKSNDYLAIWQAFIDGGQTTGAFYQQDVGVPAIFLKDDFKPLLALTGDVGAKKILKTRLQSNSLVCVDLAQASIDIDTQADLTVWLANKE
ncbi:MULTISPECIES: nucleotidyltransferase family protein [Pseudomonadati]|uniref:Nucleotidyltransferase family protein n=1 Tax=Shewanella aestuarii TaxID=1028752 RepID=A0ABT0KY88_9GAMM|nr:nucleotidyltransferase family protein [Shewanella aestuarii]MCL1116225.1 nucleotidyltransferase family protein [Shewanella aestuarii]GGN71047.1 xanthine dehydrogenase [Shewanella aestuarii]